MSGLPEACVSKVTSDPDTGWARLNVDGGYPMVVQRNTNTGNAMGVHKQSVSFTEAAFAFARELVERGEYPNISAAVSGEMARARLARERDQALFEAELRRRLELPLETWEPLQPGDNLTSDTRAYLAQRASDGA